MTNIYLEILSLEKNYLENSQVGVIEGMWLDYHVA